MNSARDPLNSAIPVQILVVNEVVGPVYSARDPLAGLCSRASQLKKKGVKSLKHQKRRRGWK